MGLVFPFLMNQTHQRNSVKEYTHTANINFTSFFCILLLFFYLKMVINMKNNVKLNENNTKVSNIGHCALPEEIKHEKSFCFAANGTGDFTNKQPLTVSNGNLIPANEGGWKLNTYSDLMKSLEENPQVKTQIHNPAVGFLCTPEYVVLDIDGHGKEGLSDAKKDFVSRYAETTYCEKSLSGNGYHMIFRCDSPITSGKINVDFGEGLDGIEVFGGVECKIHVILTGNSNGKEINHLPDELREKIKEAAKNRDSTKQKTFYSGICNESARLLAKINQPPVEIYCKLFNATVEEKRFKETRCITNYFEENFGIQAHHFGVTADGSWCLYGNNMKGGGLIEAVAVVEGLYDFDEGKIKNQSDIPKIIEITKKRFNIPEENTITIEGLQKIQKKASEARSIYKPYYDTIKDRLPSVIRTWVDAVSLLTGAYKEYSIVNLLTIGAILTCGRAKYLEYHGCTEKRVSFRTFILGQSSISNKTTAIKLAKQLLEKVERDWWGLKWGSAAELPDGNRVDIAPTFYADLDAIYTEARLLQDFADNNIRYLIDDESGSQLLSMMKREYNGTLRDVLCKICDGSDVHKTLKKTKKNDALETDFHIIHPIFNCIIASTPETFQSYARPDDATSGYLYRFLYCTPMYSKKKVLKQDIRKNRPKFNEIENSVIKELANILKFFEKSTMTYEFSEESEIFLDEWEEKSTKSLTREQQLSLESRLQAYVLDIAVLLHILAGNYDVQTVNEECVMLAAEMIDGLFRPSGNFMIDGTANDDLNKLSALVKKLTANGTPVSRSKLLMNAHMDRSKFNLLIDTLCESGQVQRRIDKDSDASVKPTFYIWSEYDN